MDYSNKFLHEFAKTVDSRSILVINSQGRLILNGGMIFHGSHDSGGSGSAPTFSVNMTPTTGWAIHT